MSEPSAELRARIENTIRFLAVDAVERASSGHPGAPMGLARPAFELWAHHLRFDPSDPRWELRDRFVLSNGHASMLLYSLLHLFGFDLPMDELVRFRQLGSRTPGHPEYGDTPGVEITTGPLGQGLANAVGMALAERLLAAEFNRPGLDIVDHHTYVFTGDGCLMEGVSHEACALAGMREGRMAVIGGTDVFGLFLGWGYDLFHLSRAGRVRLPGGRPVFPGVPARSPEDLLSSHGLTPAETQVLDPTADLTLVTWRAS